MSDTSLMDATPMRSMRLIDSSVEAMGVRSRSSLFNDAVTSMRSIWSVSVGMELSSTSATGLANARANIAKRLFMLQSYNAPTKNATPIYGGIRRVFSVLPLFQKFVYSRR